jgi:hypothetical protein
VMQFFLVERVGDFDTPAEHFSEFCDPSHVWGRRTVCLPPVERPPPA